MKSLSVLVASSGLAIGYAAWASGDFTLVLLAVIIGLSAVAVANAAGRSRFVRIIIVYFAVQMMVLSGIVGTDALGGWPASLDYFKAPATLAMTAAVFCIAFHAASFVPIVRRALAIADRYLDADTAMQVRLGFGARVRIRETTFSTFAIFAILFLNQINVFLVINLTTVASSLQNALQNYDSAAFWRVIGVDFPIYLTPLIAATLIQNFIQYVLVLRWRRYLTERYIDAWLDDHNHYHMMLAGVGTDNPDQRIAEDIPRFLDGGDMGALGIFSFSMTLISTMSALVSFSIILWNLSDRLTLPGSVQVPGFLLWCAIAYAVLGTVATHLVGRPLAKIAFERQHCEADFRFCLARLREYSEQIALLSGEQAEKSYLRRRFDAIVRNFYKLIVVRTRLAAFLNLFQEFSGYIPYIIAAPFYMMKLINLGDLMQIRLSFGAVNSALTVFVSYYQSLAEFKSVLDRLTSFDAALETSRASRGAATVAITNDEAFVLSDLALALPTGRILLDGLKQRFPSGQNLLLTGASGTGKSTLLRALSGAWPHLSGAIERPDRDRIMVLPQKPYLPIGTLLAAVSYPATSGTFSREAATAALRDVGLAQISDDLDVEDNWAQRLSGGEQQRLAAARALLVRPDWLLLDEATSAMDVAMESQLYEMLARRLPDTTLISTGHRDSLIRHHDRRLHAERGADGRVAFVTPPAASPRTIAPELLPAE